MSVLVISDVLGLFANKLTADDKYSLRNRKKLSQPIQMQLSNKEKIILFFCCISGIEIKFWKFWNKDDPHRLCVLENRDNERRG